MAPSGQLVMMSKCWGKPGSSHHLKLWGFTKQHNKMGFPASSLETTEVLPSDRNGLNRESQMEEEPVGDIIVIQKKIKMKNFPGIPRKGTVDRVALLLWMNVHVLLWFSLTRFSSVHSFHFPSVSHENTSHLVGFRLFFSQMGTNFSSFVPRVIQLVTTILQFTSHLLVGNS